MGVDDSCGADRESTVLAGVHLCLARKYSSTESAPDPPSARANRLAI
jgi:hypothetical protein